MRVAATVALGIGVSAVTLRVAFAVLWGAFLAYIFAGTAAVGQPPASLRATAAVVFNLVLAALVTLLPIWATWRWAPPLRASALGALLIAGALMGIAAPLFLHQRAFVTRCLAEPWGGRGACFDLG